MDLRDNEALKAAGEAKCKQTIKVLCNNKCNGKQYGERAVEGMAGVCVKCSVAYHGGDNI